LSLEGLAGTQYSTASVWDISQILSSDSIAVWEQGLKPDTFDNLQFRGPPLASDVVNDTKKHSKCQCMPPKDVLEEVGLVTEMHHVTIWCCIIANYIRERPILWFYEECKRLCSSNLLKCWWEQ